ncbi:MAG: hypothetical protein HC780_13575 [Leptolyngbyaceae cyanobacterium CSU_1_3]|nr:hypothetical protein [Leptolyngbyaceae cyanobacterium CSU_1_3]
MTKGTLILSSLLTLSLLTGFTLFARSSTVQAQQRSGWQPFFQRIVSRSPLPRKRGGGRGDWEVVSPGAWTKQLWTLQPSLIWRVNPAPKQLFDRVEIAQLGSRTPLWSQTIQPNRNGTIPITLKLEPSKTYFVRFLKRNADLQKDEIVSAWEFQVMSIAQRQKVAEALDLLNKNLKPSELLQQRIEVFAKYELWSDAFQEIDRSTLSAIDRQTAIEHLLTQLKATEPTRNKN